MVRLILALGIATASTAVAKDYRIDQLDPAAKSSYYSQRLPKALEHWPLPTLSIKDKRPEIERAIKTPGNENLVGMVKHFEINAPLERVVQVCDRFEDYPKIWEDVVSVKVESRDKNRVVTAWMRKAPAFFLQKIRYRMSTVVDKAKPGRVVYRHQLIDGNMVITSDSLVVYEKLAADRTRVTVLNFFEPDVGGLVHSLAEGKVWKQAMRDGFKDDIAFRARVEHPEWDIDRISDEAEKALDTYPIDEIEYTDLIKFP